jgi:hypothetical protein
VEVRGGDKMDRKACYYTVAKYLPDPVRNEPRNIGVIVQCRDFEYVNCKYFTNLQARLGSTATKSDIKIIKAYVEEFSENFNPFAKFPSTKSFLAGRPDEFLKEDYLSNLAKEGLGKIQFSEPRGCLTDDPEKELEYLFKTFVAEEIAKEKEAVKHSRLKTEVKQEFKKNKLLVLPKERDKKKGFEMDTKIPGGRSKVEHLLDFVFRNEKIYLVETVDFRKKDWASETFEAAVKFDDLKHGLGDKIDPYSIVALPGNDGVEDYLKILASYSNVYHYTTEKEKKEFIYEMKELVASEPSLFPKSQSRKNR